MHPSSGSITARLADVSPDRFSQLVALINQNIKPPDSVEPSDVFIRAMYLASDEVNSFGGKFPPDELQRLANLVIDSPVLVGHRKDRLPVGRTFFAEIVPYSGQTWVKSYFYWLKTAEGGLTLKENIDGGIYKECSVGFTFQYPECSICHEDIRRCEHEPFAEYPSATGQQICHFLYRNVQRVLESSLVYRGAVPGTAVTKELSVDNEPIRLNYPAELDMSGEYMVTPNYEGVFVSVTHADGCLELIDSNGNAISSAHLSFDLTDLDEFTDTPAILIGLRGKERCSEEDVLRFIESGRGPVSRVILKLYPTLSADGGFSAYGGNKTIGLMPHDVATVGEIDEVSRKLMTRDGVRIWSVTDAPGPSGYIYHPSTDKATESGGFQLCLGRETDTALLSIYHGSNTRQFRIRQFNLARFRKGARYLGDEVPLENAPQGDVSGNMYVGGMTVRDFDDSLVMSLTGQMEATIILRPAKINGLKRYLLYCVDEQGLKAEPHTRISISEADDEQH